MNSKLQISGETRKGFTLVEIMIVVVIIGLLAAMAIPAFQRVRENSINSRMDNDARQLASAAQQYFLEHSVSEVDPEYNDDTGELENEAFQGYLRTIGSDYTLVTTGTGEAVPADGDTHEGVENVAFTLDHALVPLRFYNPEGQFIEAEDE